MIFWHCNFGLSKPLYPKPTPRVTSDHAAFSASAAVLTPQKQQKENLSRDMSLYLEDLEASNVQDANEGGSLAFGPVQGFVDAVHEPAEQALVGGLCQGFHCKVRLQTQTGTFIYPGKAIKRTQTWMLSQITR